MADDYSVNGKMTLDNSQFLKSVDEAQSSISDFGKGIKDSTSKFSEGLKNWGVDFDKMFKKGSDLFKSFGLDIEKLASHFGVSGKLLVGIATCTMALNKFGAEMNEVSIEIAKGTGETGEKLRKLTETAEKTMVKGFGRSTKELGVMVADLNTRFGATGEQLQDLTGEFDKFARITDTDVKGSINEVADIINKWGMSTLEVNPLLDQLTVASQKSGASVADLMSGLKSGQAIFSQFGMSTTKTIAFLSSLKQNGISTESALTGMRTALAKFSSEGIEASAGLQKVISEIQNAKSDTDALNISLKTFGTRAGAEMVQAFRSGTASVDDFVSALENAGGAVEKTNEFSRSSALAMTELKNSLKGTFSGFGKGINDLFTDLIDSVKSLVEFLSPIIEPIGDIIGDVFSTIGEIIKTLIQAFTEFQTKYNTIYNGLVKTLETIKETFHKVFGNIVEQLKNVIGFISALFKGNWALVWEYAKKILLTFAKNVSDILSGIVNLFVNGVNSIIEVINKAIDKYNAVAEKFDWKKIGNVDEIGKVDFAESWGIEEQIEKIQEKIDELTGKTAEKVIGELGKVSDEAVKSAKEVSYKMSEVTAEWNAKLLQQDIELIEMERDEVAGRASIFGASEEQIFDIKKEYNDRIFELKKKQLEEEKALELENVKNSQESAEEKLKQIEAINTYYERTLKILKQVNENSSTTNKMKKYSNTLKEIGKFSNELFSSINLFV